MTENIITVTGRGEIKVTPDQTRINLTLKNLHNTYAKAFEQAKLNTDALSQAMISIGQDSSLPKTISFEIHKMYKDRYGNITSYERDESKFAGFELEHHVKIEIGIDNVLLGSILNRIGKTLPDAQIELGFTTKDTHPAQLEMLEKAVNDAKEKAELMANTLGCTLGSVKEINHSVKRLEIYSRFADCDSNCDGDIGSPCCKDESIDITPEDISACDEVTIQWYLNV